MYMVFFRVIGMNNDQIIRWQKIVLVHYVFLIIFTKLIYVQTTYIIYR